MVAAYAVAFQMLFTGIAASSLTTAAPGSNGDPFVICYGDRGAPAENQNPAGHPLHQQHCVLCTTAAAPAAILPTAAGHILRPIGGARVRWPKTSDFVPAQRSTPRLSQGPPQTT
jgi:hypothetical protein